MAVNQGNGGNNGNRQTPNQGQAHTPTNYGASPTGGEGLQQQMKDNPQPHQPPYGDAPQRQRGMRSVNEALRRSGTSERSEARVAEALKHLTQGVEEAITSQVLKDRPDLYRFDRQQQSVLISAILATMAYNVGNKKHIAVRPLLLESTDAPLPRRQRRSGSMNEEMQMLPQDVYDERYWNAVVKFVREQAKAPDAIVHDAGVLFIPEASRIKDQSVGFDFNDSNAVKELLVQTTNRLEDALAVERGEQPLNLAQIKRDDERLRVRIDTSNQQPVTDSVGNPVRADMIVAMKLVSNDHSQGQDMGFVKEDDLNQVTAFVDFEYTRPPTNQQMIYGQQPPRPFTPVIVATSVTNAAWVEAQTLELYLLALSNLYRTMKNNAWALTRNPTFTAGLSGKGINTRDIGALAYLVTGKKIELTGKGATDEDFLNFIEQMIEPNPAFAIDVDLMGDNIAMERNFLMAAGGSMKQQAKDFIIASCNNLTNNNFSQHFNPANDIVSAAGMESNLGRYPDGSGEMRDLRDLDTVAALNLSKGNIEDFRRWYSTRNLEGNETFESAMRRREAIERNWLSPNMTITRRAPRLIFTPAFLDALDQAFADAGALFEMEDVIGLESNQFLGNTGISQFRVSSQPRLNQGGGSTNNGAYHMPNYHYPPSGHRY